MTQRASTQLKAIRGTQRADRAPKQTGGERLTKAPPPPGNLSPAAAGEWNALADVLTRSGALVSSDLRPLELLCETLATETVLRAILKNGLMTGLNKAHPAFRMQITTRTLAARLLTDFGLTPKARQAVDFAPLPDEEEAAWEKMMAM
ncbi:MAG: P27 family phage terminase small subunit [Burkholderiales bacterium]|nr:P27 family phage terminase small subunit [Burkholderiales bacterium]